MTPSEISAALKKMQDDPDYITNEAYSPLATESPDNMMPFAQVHEEYLKKHRTVNPIGYLSNLRIMLRKR